jgi:hypothetical protein
MSRFTLWRAVLTIALVMICAIPSAAPAATPPSATLTPDASGHGSVSWTGNATVGTDAAGDSDGCFDADGKPDPTSGCDFFNLDVTVPAGFYDNFLGGVQVTLDGFGQADLDLGIYERKADGSRGERVTGSGNAPGEIERTTISEASGAFIMAIVPFAVAGTQSYNGKAEFEGKAANPSLAQLNKTVPAGLPNYRASHDKYLSHSEPSIAMDPLNHDHLIAGSKMYENLGKYLFKIGTYESFDGGVTWKDLGQLPGYCQDDGQCDPSNEELYRTVSDVSMAFDDEGNAYAQVLDAPGGTAGFTGFNMTIHIKKPGDAQFSGPITVHDNRNNPITEQLLLDDKNWLAIDNNTLDDGSPNKLRDGKIGTMYVCWSFDGTQAPSQQIVIMRSTDGGQTWGGVAPGDNTPLQLSQKGAISGIGCHIIIGTDGQVWVTWYDNQVDALMQVTSVDHGHSFTPARPIATIVGVNEQFPGQSFRNLSIPTTGIDKDGNIYIAAASQKGEGAPVAEGTSVEQLKELRDHRSAETEAEGDAGSGADIVMFKSTDGGVSYTGPVRVNQDGEQSPADQFQPWLAVTDKGQVDVMYFDRRQDPNNFFIDTYLSRSNDGGKTFEDTRVGERLWDPRLNPPISVSGAFIGDYQGLAADDVVAIPFWNSTQDDSRAVSDPEHSVYQEVFAARVSNTKPLGGPAGGPSGGSRCLDKKPPRSTVKRRGLKLRPGRVVLAGKSRDVGGCATAAARTPRDRGGIKRVLVSIAKVRGRHGCRFLTRKGVLSPKRGCRRPILLRAKGSKRWRLSRAARLPRGKYRAVARAVDRAGNKERPRKGRNIIRFTVR